MSGAEDGGTPDATPRVKAGRPRRQPTTSTLADRSAAERDEWATAGEIATGLDRARVALALAARRSAHALAEGHPY